MRLKHNVKLNSLTTQAALGMCIVSAVYHRLDPSSSCTFTSVNDSKHSDKSLHYHGNAFDVRTKDFTANKQYLVAEVKAALGPDYDVVLEALGTDNEHLHVEYQPKGNS
jgi:hypothetical protein